MNDTQKLKKLCKAVIEQGNGGYRNSEDECAICSSSWDDHDADCPYELAVEYLEGLNKLPRSSK